jgi:hypothetical protein
LECCCCDAEDGGYQDGHVREHNKESKRERESKRGKEQTRERRNDVEEREKLKLLGLGFFLFIPM